jgi:hypothetical protein
VKEAEADEMLELNLAFEATKLPSGFFGGSRLRRDFPPSASRARHGSAVPRSTGKALLGLLEILEELDAPVG